MDFCSVFLCFLPAITQFASKPLQFPFPAIPLVSLVLEMLPYFLRPCKRDRTLQLSGSKILSNCPETTCVHGSVCQTEQHQIPLSCLLQRAD